MIKFAIMKNFLNYRNDYGMNPFNDLDELYIDSTFEELRLGLIPFDLHNRLKEMFERVSDDLKKMGLKTYLFSTNPKITEKQLGTFTSKGNKVTPTELTALSFNFSTLQEINVNGAFNFLVTSGLFAIKLINVKDLNNIIFLKPSVFTTNEFSFSFDVENFASLGKLIDNEEYILDYDILLDKTSQLVNNGEDGINPFITLLDSTLQSVTDNGNITTNNIILGAGIDYVRLSQSDILINDDEDGFTRIRPTETIISLNSNDFTGTVTIENSVPTETAEYIQLRPNKSGTYAMLDDVATKQNIKLSRDSNFTAVDEQIYSITQSVTITNPTGVTGRGYEFEVLSGTTTVGNRTFGTGSYVKVKFQGGFFVYNLYAQKNVIENITLTPANWILVSGNFQATITNALIFATSTPIVTPTIATANIADLAEIFEDIIVSNGSFIITARYLPTTNIVIKTTLL
jgi:hypothetical protein